ncbi:hypothetical protein [uncultured Caulobacter sp.]|uniref:hypothetical protein n=1 Tax=uncultured Caulobacter sp. TaxID=158749 RepID=UPI00262C03DD|nr:hypothetical protein [uncultured Caulobacter sp.]
MSGELWLRAAYGANIVILAPVLTGLLLLRNGPGVPALGGAIAESEGLRLLVASLWGAILVLSAAGLVAPRLFWPVLLLQIVYKSAWLLIYVLPLWRAAGPTAVPWGPTAVFAAIVVLWPMVLAAAARSGALAA